jgi:hypothetical protein
MGRVGFEHPPETPSRTAISTSGDAKSDALKDENDSNLAWLTKAWPTLPESTRKQIIDAARAALKSGGPVK